MVIESRPYCLYGTVRDAVDHSPVLEGVHIETTDASFSETNQPHFALFFDEPGPRELTVADSSFQRRYLSARERVEIAERLQRHDVLLQPIARSESAIRLHVEISGVRASEGVSLYVHGQDVSTNEYGDRTAFDVVLPKPGLYDVGAHVNDHEVNPAEGLQIDREQTVRLQAVEKRTHLTVHVRDADGFPVVFPPVQQLHEQPINCVVLERAGDTATAASPSWRHASSGSGGAGSAVRPDEHGDAQFLLATGGAYHLVIDLQRYERFERDVELKTGETTAMDIVLKEKRMTHR